MQSRPRMHAKNSSGKQVSLLNDESSPFRESRPVFRSPDYAHRSNMVRSNSINSGISTASSPSTPGLLRSDSYDSQTTNDPVSPITPVYMADYDKQPSYTSAGYLKGSPSQYEQSDRAVYDYTYPANQQYSMQNQYTDSRVASYAESQTYEEDSYGNQNERGAKRYPCRFRDSHHCEKTFTTSGHASRHSKIHTAEKAVHCTYQGCQKKFTRADNMKQHLETHFKHGDKRSSAQKPSSKSSLISSAGIRKTSSAGHSSTSGRNLNPAEHAPYDPALFTDPYATHSATASPSMQYGAFDVGGVRSAVISRPAAAARPHSSSGGLDLLANIAALHN